MGSGIWQVRRQKEMYTVLLWGDLKEADHLQGPGVVDGIILK
jgi:hypothetical protein